MQSYSVLHLTIFITFLLLVSFFVRSPMSCYFEVKNYQTNLQGQNEMINDLKYSLVVFVGKGKTNEITYLRCN